VTDQESNFSDSDNESDICLRDTNFGSSSEKLRGDLAGWALTHNITSVAVDELLGLFRESIKEVQLPLCSKSLLKTPSNYHIESIAGGKYYHFGIENQIRHILGDTFLNSNIISVVIGIDGLPISKSSKKQFWPILGLCEFLSKTPFIIGLYYSLVSKPLSVEEFLRPFIDEYKQLKNRGFIHNCVRYEIKIHCLIADAPARNFLKCSAAFNGYNGCDRCVQKGTWSGRVIFKDNFARLRTDSDFRNQIDKSHHIGISPLLKLDVGLVSDVVLDYMHVVCLGVVKKLLTCWKKALFCIGKAVSSFLQFLKNWFL